MYPWRKRTNRLRWLGLAAILAVLGGFVVLAQTAPIDSLRIIESPPDGGIQYHQPETVISSKEIRPVTTGDQGRGVSIFAPHATIFDTLFQPGSDDALGFVGDCHGSVVVNCLFEAGTTRPNDAGKAVIGYTNAAGSNLPGPIFGADVGYFVTFIGDDFRGAAVRLSGGVYQFIRCRFAIGALGAIQAMDARINLIDCDFYTVPQPANWTYWYQNGDPCGVRVVGLVNGKQAAAPLNSRLYVANCRLDGKPADGPTLCRRFPNAADVKGGLTAYAGKGSVPSYVFLRGPN